MTPQKVFCNACGARCDERFPNVMGREWRRCSIECVREMNWRDTLSIMKKPYTERPRGEEDKE